VRVAALRADDPNGDTERQLDGGRPQWQRRPTRPEHDAKGGADRVANADHGPAKTAAAVGEAQQKVHHRDGQQADRDRLADPGEREQPRRDRQAVRVGL
jgi:hypothetical protein